MNTPETTQWLLETINRENWADQLKAELKVHKMTQKEFAARVGCHVSTLNAILNWRTGYTVLYIPKRVWRAYRDLPWHPAPVAPVSEPDHGQPSGTTGAAQPAADVHPSS